MPQELDLLKFTPNELTSQTLTARAKRRLRGNITRVGYYGILAGAHSRAIKALRRRDV